MKSEPPQKPYRIVVGFDFSELSERALDEAFWTATARMPAEIHVITVACPAGTLLRLPGDAETILPELGREAVRLSVGEAAEAYQARRGPIGVDRIAVYVVTGVPPGEAGKPIVDFASALGADLIVVGTHGRTAISRFLMGSVAARVVHDATTSVQVVRAAGEAASGIWPAIEPTTPPDRLALKHFEPHRTYHYVDKVAPWTQRQTPVS